MANNEVCCLSELVLPRIESELELLKCAQYVYRVCKHTLTLNAPAVPETEQIVQKNMRIGISVSGYLQASEIQRSWLSNTYKYLREFDVMYSKMHGLPESVKLTTIKPAGTTGLVTHVTPGIHPAFARYYIRRVRIASGSPLVEACRLKGFPVENQIAFDGTKDSAVCVVSFPCKAPKQCLLADNLSAIDQLEWAMKAQQDWSDNSISITVLYRASELPNIQQWLAENYTNKVKSTSFMLYNDHGFIQAPYERIERNVYKEMKQKLNELPIEECLWECTHEQIGSDVDELEDELIQTSSLECSGGVCPIR